MATVLTIRFEFEVDGTLTDPTAIVLSDSTGAYGIRVTGGANVLAADTDISGGKISTGVYEYEFTEANGAVYDTAYTSYVKVTYDSRNYYFDEDHDAVSEPGAAILTTYQTLLERVGHFLFGIRSSFSSDQTDDITDAIRDGLRDVYAAHDWSFFKPVKTITTTVPYSTGTITVVDGVVTLSGGTFPSWSAVGVLKASNSYYAVDTRDGDTQLTLEDTTLDVDAGTSYELGREEYDLPTGFDGIIGKELNYEPGETEFYPAVEERHDDQIRAWQHRNPEYGIPRRWSIRTVEFDATVGSRKRLALYPAADAAYSLRVPMRLRPIMLDQTNAYPVGGEQLSQLILEACLAAAERLYDDSEGVHTKRFNELLPQAIMADQETSSPRTLGPDAPRSSRTTELSRASLVQTVTLNGVEM